MKRGFLLAIGLTSGCAYYNAMWRAERFAKDARRLEARGQEAEARSYWARAAVKAESVVARHPRSRWADDALVLQAEALARAGACGAADAPITKARATVTDRALRERAGLAAAHCAVAAGQPVQAAEALEEALASEDGGRRSRAEYLAGQAATLRLDHGGAVEHFRRSREAGALPARARALIAAGRTGEASAVMDTLATAPLRSTDRSDLLAQLAAAAGAAAASVALDRQLERARLPFAEQARLLIEDGDRHLAGGEPDAAVARYRRAAAVAPITTPEAGTARVREQRALLAIATEPADLSPILDELERLAHSDGPAAAAARQLLDLVAQAANPQAGLDARFRAAELMRDSLSAARLAGRLFLHAAATDSTSLYAPKALLAALPLLPDRHDSIVAVLDARYATSPYTRAFHGEASVAYTAAEDSLARAQGVQIGSSAQAVATRIDAPLTGPRGPWLDDPVRGTAASGVRQPGRPADRPVRERPVQPERPPP